MSSNPYSRNVSTYAGQLHDAMDAANQAPISSPAPLAGATTATTATSSSFPAPPPPSVVPRRVGAIPFNVVGPPLPTGKVTLTTAAAPSSAVTATSSAPPPDSTATSSAASVPASPPFPIPEAKRTRPTTRSAPELRPNTTPSRPAASIPARNEPIHPFSVSLPAPQKPAAPPADHVAAVPWLIPPRIPTHFAAPPPPTTTSPIPLVPYITLDMMKFFAQAHPGVFETMVGLYLQEANRSPSDIGGQRCYTLGGLGWVKSPRWLDIVAAGGAVGEWEAPEAEDFWAVGRAFGHHAATFEELILWWAQVDEKMGGGNVGRVLRRAGWIPRKEIQYTAEWLVVHNIFVMNEGQEKVEKLAQLKEESPRLLDWCLDDWMCGRFYIGELPKAIIVKYTRNGREETHPKLAPKPDFTMSGGQPMQVHSVPLEERAFDSKGNRLPWALEWPEGHPNARGQKRHIEEKGPFGKSNKRKGSSRTRTATPAKKENPTLDSFEKALAYDINQLPPSSQTKPPPTRTQQNESSIKKQPTQVMLYGYPSTRQWQALSTYEKSCGNGFICEDYDRQPDSSLRRYPNPLSQSPHTHAPRPLTREERTLTFQYAGGAHWVKVTFDSAEAAERVVEISPIRVQNCWVYAQHFYQGMKPQRDEPIELTAEEHAAGKPLSRHLAFGPAFSTQPLTATTPSTATTDTTTTATTTTQPDSSGTSTTTATSPDANDNNSTLRHRHQHNPAFARPLPHLPLLPAHLALLPTPTFWERQSRWLAQHGVVLPGEMIGNGIPRFDNGEPDWGNASVYWRVCGWVDGVTGWDLCGLREDD